MSMSDSNGRQPLFPLGHVVATPSALEELTSAEQDPMDLIHRHQRGDWGEVDEADRKENDFSVDNHLRILSAYRLTTDVKIWIITEADRSVTTLLLPGEY